MSSKPPLVIEVVSDVVCPWCFVGLRTVVPNVLDEQHRPILLISALAEHTKNLLADPKVSISVTETGTRRGIPLRQ